MIQLQTRNTWPGYETGNFVDHRVNGFFLHLNHVGVITNMVKLEERISRLKIELLALQQAHEKAVQENQVTNQDFQKRVAENQVRFQQLTGAIAELEEMQKDAG